MESKKLMFVSFIVLLVIALQPQAVCGDSDIISCESFSKKSTLGFILHAVTSRTFHCPMFCCTEDFAGIPFCCDFFQYAYRNTGILIGITSAIIFLVIICCCVCYKCKKQPGFQRIDMPRFV